MYVFNSGVKLYPSLSYIMILYSTVRPLYGCMKVFFKYYCKKVKLKAHTSQRLKRLELIPHSSA